MKRDRKYLSDFQKNLIKREWEITRRNINYQKDYDMIIGELRDIKINNQPVLYNTFEEGTFLSEKQVANIIQNSKTTNKSSKDIADKIKIFFNRWLIFPLSPRLSFDTIPNPLLSSNTTEQLNMDIPRVFTELFHKLNAFQGVECKEYNAMIQLIVKNHQEVENIPDGVVSGDILNIDSWERPFREKYKPPREINLKIDLDSDVSNLLEWAEFYIKGMKSLREDFIPEVKEVRYRFEDDFICLEIWDLQKKYKNYEKTREILCKEKNIPMNYDTVRKKYYRAYELIYGEEYNPEEFKKNNSEILKITLTKNCSNCSEKPTCKQLCPDVLNYVKQDEVKPKEKLNRY